MLIGNPGMKAAFGSAATVAAALRSRRGATLVVKYGGAAMIDARLKDSFAGDVARIAGAGIPVVVVHGGGPGITELASRLGLKAQFVDGLRVTDDQMMEVVEMTLAGVANTEIVASVNRHGGRAVGVSGVDGGILRVRKHRVNGKDLGRVGDVISVDTTVLRLLAAGGFTPVVAPLGVDSSGVTYNVNADMAADKIAAAVSADELIILSDVAGVSGGEGIVSEIDCEEAERLIREGVVSGGMIPKLRSAFEALRAGVGAVRLVDGRSEHALLDALTGRKQGGTRIVSGRSAAPPEAGQEIHAAAGEAA